MSAARAAARRSALGGRGLARADPASPSPPTPSRPQLLVFAAAPPEPRPSGCWRRARRAPGGSRWRWRRWPTRTRCALLDGVAGPDGVRRIVRDAGGNPLFLREPLAARPRDLPASLVAAVALEVAAPGRGGAGAARGRRRRRRAVRSRAGRGRRGAARPTAARRPGPPGDRRSWSAPARTAVRSHSVIRWSAGQSTPGTPGLAPDRARARRGGARARAPPQWSRAPPRGARRGGRAILTAARRSSARPPNPSAASPAAEAHWYRAALRLSRRRAPQRAELLAWGNALAAGRAAR